MWSFHTGLETTTVYILRIYAAMNALGGGRQNWLCPRARETLGTILVDTIVW